MSKPGILRNIEIADLVSHYPFSIKFLSEKGIRCIACGEPIWGSLEEAALEKGFQVDQISVVVNELIELSKV